VPEVISLNPHDLQANSWNSNYMSPENEAKLDASIRRLGMFKSVIVRETLEGYQIIGGEHRWESAKRVGLKTISVINLGSIDDQKAKEISLADNARYGADDTVALANMLNEMDIADIAQFLPFTDTDVALIFSSKDIALDDLELDEKFETSEDTTLEITKPIKVPKTHTIMRFKVGLKDAEKISELIARTQVHEGFTASDELTNAGDALVHLLGESSI